MPAELLTSFHEAPLCDWYSDGAALCYGEQADTGSASTLGRGVALTSDDHPVVLGWVTLDFLTAERWLGQFGVPR